MVSIVELALAGTVAGILLVSVVRLGSNEADRATVVAAQGDVLNAYRLAQATARTLGRPAVLVVSVDSITIQSVGRDTLTIARLPGPRARGVTLTPAWHAITFGPAGVAAGAGNVTHTLGRGSIARAVVVSRLGRVRVS